MAQKKTDAAATVRQDGSLTNGRLHEQMTQGVNDHDLRLRTKQRLAELGVPVEDLNRVLPA